MAAKKGKGKGKGKGKNSAAKAEELRLAQLRQLEAEAEEFQENERRRREREEQDERISLVREEQLRQIREKEKRIDELSRRVNEVVATLKDDRLSYESEIEHLSVLRDSLLNEVSLLKAEHEEQQQLFAKERQCNYVEVERVTNELSEARKTLNEENESLRVQLHEANEAAEEHRQKYEEIVEEKDACKRDHTLKARALERELEKALTMNAALQQAVGSREADDRKNVALMQMLNAQLDENRRHFDEQLDDEKKSTLKAKQEVERLEAKCAKLQEELEAALSENVELKRRSEGELNEYQQHLEQVKYDSQYLSTELEAMRQQCTESMQGAESAKTEAEIANKELVVAAEALEKKVEALESLLYKKDREYYDKVTFMNAQLANNRTVIAQLQNKLTEEREGHECELERRTIDVRRTLEELKEMNAAEAQRSAEHATTEKQLLGEIASLKTEFGNLEVATANREKKSDCLIASQADEIKRLRDILDSHFIPHRKDLEACRNSEKVDTILVLHDKLAEKDREMQMREQAAAETELWLKSRIANQAEMIEALQTDLKRGELSHLEQVRCLEDEIARLRKTLEIHYIPCTM